MTATIIESSIDIKHESQEKVVYPCLRIDETGNVWYYFNFSVGHMLHRGSRSNYQKGIIYSQNADVEGMRLPRILVDTKAFLGTLKLVSTQV